MFQSLWGVENTSGIIDKAAPRQKEKHTMTEFYDSLSEKELRRELFTIYKEMADNHEKRQEVNSYERVLDEHREYVIKRLGALGAFGEPATIHPFDSSIEGVYRA